MYSRYSSGRGEKPLHVPEHYSGCAFPKVLQKDPSPRAVDIARPTPLPPPSLPPDPPQSDAECDEPISPPPPPSEAEPKQEKDIPASAHPLPFVNGLDFDQLLILGLILLLSHQGTDPDIVLWLGLLLFCG